MTTPAWLATFLAVLALLGLGVLAMAVGVIFRRPCLRGSCGGPAWHGASGEEISCATCPHRRHRAEPAAEAAAQPPAADPG